MNAQKVPKSRVWALAAGVLATMAVAGGAQAGSLTEIAAPAAGQIKYTVADGRYRLSNNNWDMAIAPAGNPTSSMPQSGFGNVASLTTDTYGFSFGYDKDSSKYTFTMNGTSSSPTLGSSGLTTKTLEWTNSQAYNTIHLNLKTNSFNEGNPSTLRTSSGALTNLSFSSAALTPNFTFKSPFDGPPTDSQWLLADVNLANYDWTISGNVQLAKTGTLCDECAAFDITTKQTVPIPAALFFVAPALLGVLGFYRRKPGNLAA